mmetsp:Transcript_38817/g.102637  ORF Transcript_38817/g.102637 Transcript_38817/m.102637 type:complete len:219 (+) Transcript_38817:25-681(+)
MALQPHGGGSGQRKGLALEAGVARGEPGGAERGEGLDGGGGGGGVRAGAAVGEGGLRRGLADVGAEGWFAVAEAMEGRMWRSLPHAVGEGSPEVTRKKVESFRHGGCLLEVYEGHRKAEKAWKGFLLGVYWTLSSFQHCPKSFFLWNQLPCSSSGGRRTLFCRLDLFLRRDSTSTKGDSSFADIGSIINSEIQDQALSAHHSCESMTLLGSCLRVVSA